MSLKRYIRTIIKDRFKCEMCVKFPTFDEQFFYLLDNYKEEMIESLSNSNNIPLVLIKKLAFYKDFQIHLIQYKVLPIEVLDKLIDTKKTEIIQSLIKNRKLNNIQISRILELNNVFLDMAITKRKNLPIEVIYKLSKHTYESIRAQIALKPNLPDDLIKKFSLDCEIVRDNLYRKVKPIKC